MCVFQGWRIQIQYKYAVKVPYILKSLKTSQFQVISGILESKSKNYQRYQKQDIFQLLRPNSSSVTKIKLNWCPICQNWQKNGHFQALSRVPEIFWKFPGMMKFWNNVLKIKFLGMNWVGLMPYKLILVKTSQFLGTSGILVSRFPRSRNHNISQNVCKINTNMLPRLVFFINLSKTIKKHHLLKSCLICV